MRVPGLKFMRSALRWSSLVHQRHVLVLGYHRIAEANWDPHNICVSPKHFDEQLEVLSSLANPISLETLVSSLGRNAPPSRGVVLTLDDGYLDSLTVAAPALRRFDVPATIFVSTGWMGLVFWWDKLT
jgi:peptidoglycan/xylan/chitin deacetylase (PgdA/CDA1 family)